MGAAVGRRGGGPRGPGGSTKHGRKAATPAGAPAGRSAEVRVQWVGSGQGCWWERQAGCIRGQAGSQEARVRQCAALVSSGWPQGRVTGPEWTRPLGPWPLLPLGPYRRHRSELQRVTGSHRRCRQPCYAGTVRARGARGQGPATEGPPGLASRPWEGQDHRGPCLESWSLATIQLPLSQEGSEQSW